ncbi:hypothetical protein J4212_07425 [Candidatus Woesearchaeota archaeon]|nr:hypothetical protein [Candidatus Woesearchaeota archaeon]
MAENYKKPDGHTPSSLYHALVNAFSDSERNGKLVMWFLYSGIGIYIVVLAAYTQIRISDIHRSIGAMREGIAAQIETMGADIAAQFEGLEKRVTAIESYLDQQEAPYKMELKITLPPEP